MPKYLNFIFEFQSNQVKSIKRHVLYFSDIEIQFFSEYFITKFWYFFKKIVF